MKLFLRPIHIEVVYFCDKESKERYMLDEYKIVKNALKNGKHIFAIFSYNGEMHTYCSHDILYIGKRYFVTYNGLYRYHEPSYFGF